ncbi:MAG: type II toxin-antitoxin system VapC family toxin [Chloroflexota bacterium]|nr:type II toxin-antitoxin system VapC family toxin [Chloroflexota bacterium]
MTSILMLDTDIVSYLVKERRPSIRPRFLEHDPAELCVSAVTKSELLYGLRLLESTHDLHLKVRRFLGDIEVAPWDGDAAEVHANMRHHLISTGRTIGEMDMMIAAHAVSLGAALVTNNTRHFARLSPSLVIENWVSDGGE